MNAGAQSKPKETLAQESDVDLRIHKLEAEVEGLRQDITAALAAQERLHDQLARAIEKLSELLQQRALPNASANYGKPPEANRNLGLQLGRLESRMRSVEQRVERVTVQVGGILESRIWRTLVKGSGFLLKFVR
jgi:chromosome segregation ATPase